MELLQGLKVILSVRKAPQCCDPLLALLTFHKQNLSYINTQLMFRMMFLMASLSMAPELKGTTPSGFCYSKPGYICSIFFCGPSLNFKFHKHNPVFVKPSSVIISEASVSHFFVCFFFILKSFVFALCVTGTDGLTLTPMKRSLSTIQDSRNTKALLQQKSADASVVLIFLRACRYR